MSDVIAISAASNPMSFAKFSIGAYISTAPLPLALLSRQTYVEQFVEGVYHA